MTRAPVAANAGSPQMMVYMVAMPYADGQQQAWTMPEQPHAGGAFVPGAGQHMPIAAMQPQPGSNTWNAWQELPNQQFVVQPEQQLALQAPKILPVGEAAPQSAVHEAEAAQSAKPKKKGLQNKKIEKAAKETDRVDEEAPVWQPLMPPEMPKTRAAAPDKSTADSISMIKALNLQPITLGGAAGRGRTQQHRTRADELQELKAFAAAQRAKALPAAAEAPPAAAEAPSPAATPTQRSKGIRLKNVSMARNGAVLPEKPASGISEKPTTKDAAEESRMSVEKSSASTCQPPVTVGIAVALTTGTKDFSRTLMLQFWHVCKAAPITDLGYSTKLRDGEQKPSPGDTWKFPRRDRPELEKTMSWRNDAGKAGKVSKSKEKDTLKPSATGYRVQKSETREAEIKKEVRGLLNKICPENKARIIERLAMTELHSVDELEVVINIIFHKVTDDPHYCETYVEMIQALHKAYPEFPAEEEGGTPYTFRRMLVNQCQNSFEELLASPEIVANVSTSMDPEDLEALIQKQKREAMATMKFIGHLFLRQLLAGTVIRRVIGDLLEGTPPELHVEYALELLHAVGRQFDSTAKDRDQVHIILARLRDLAGTKGTDGKPLLSKRVQFQIQDIAELRLNGWAKKGFKEEAKTIDDVHQDAAREEAKTGTQAAASRNARGYKAGRH